jgi:PRC-barrel domain
MLRQAKEFKSYKLRARDGDIGNAREFYFDDRYWTVRYLVADTGGWLSDRQVLISPYALSPANDAERVLPVNLTKKQIEESPSLESHQPVSRQYEMQYYSYYGWPFYENGVNPGGASPYIADDRETREETIRREEAWDPNLRSTSDVTGHHIQALDKEIGHVEDFIIDDQTWSIRYLVVDTKNWWAGKHVLVSPQWIERVSWAELKVFIDLSSEVIERSPEYRPESLNRDYEADLYRHYDRRGYWADEVPTKGR